MNIMNMWTTALYPASVNTYQAECGIRIAAGNQMNTETFITNVLNDFSQPPAGGVAANSTNYLDLVSLNAGGNAFFECGADPAGNGVAVVCP